MTKDKEQIEKLKEELIMIKGIKDSYGLNMSSWRKKSMGQHHYINNLKSQLQKQREKILGNVNNIRQEIQEVETKHINTAFIEVMLEKIEKHLNQNKEENDKPRNSKEN